MRRADRLFEIIQYLRGRRITTAAWLAQTLEVSERTIYRDIADLIVSGVPIDGEAGVGYILRKSYDLPPLMFTQDELSALMLGARLVQSWADPQLVKAARQAISKVESALPHHLQQELHDTPLFAPLTRIGTDVAERLTQLRAAIGQRHKVHIHYLSLQQEQSQRLIWPLGLFFWGQVWTLVAWCELREQHRSFRVDRIEQLQNLQQAFTHQRHTELQSYLREQKQQLQEYDIALDFSDALE